MFKISLVAVLALLLSSCASQNQLVKPGREPQLLADSFSFTEGPAADAEGHVYFTDQPNDRIYKWDAQEGTLSVFMESAGRANGLYFDHDGNLLAAADNKSELWKITTDKTVQVLLTDFEGKRFNGPNDIWIAPDETIYFTDPYYQRDYWQRSEKDIDAERVYALSTNGTVRIAATDFVKPNGIIGTPDGKTLYVADIGADKTYAFDIAKNGDLTNKRLFVKQGSDGMTVDSRGNVYLTGKGVTIYDPKGLELQHIPIDKDWTANVTFGGKDRKTLFITAQQAVYLLEMNVVGPRR
ncbi:SMP-30/gluconolactonase/LRE family protein [Leeuwenhoekiella marinoflava]|uniref:Gluconolactonase n=2 Tax=Leeuwenhoekiella marinoflava TaxID=988 RepID=A0A4Q0PN55_9FLAO|nr:SMP-30/gluconolactonase/LRE family protein [Leeuwenhoekiella marinoflava]RXG31917.1 gluconolactonase [Leeuwenhoekiella marinoflava]SHE91612.1 gluconolactonase [Leeuwenhoekiella marinoflava DSM 3653]